MELSPTRFISLNGAEVHATPQNAAEAKLALKEIKQKKKEFALRRRVLTDGIKQAKDAADRASGTAAQNRQRGFFASLHRMMRQVKAREPKRALSELEAELKQVDQIVLNLDGCAIQLEGKILQME